MRWSWPEWTREFTRRVLKAHRRKVNAWLIAKLEALATQQLTFDLDYSGEMANLTASTHGPGATESILSILEIVVENTRYRYRMARNKTLEMVAPYWLLGLIRSDLSKKAGNSPDRLEITDAQINRYLASRGVRVQWVYDWQDAFSNTQAGVWCVPNSSSEPTVPLPPAQIGTGFGNPAALKEWPSTVKILLYPAGSVFKLQQDIITLDGIYDHASLLENKYTSLFSEEGINVCSRCYTPTLLTISGLCPGGLSGGFGYACVPPVTPLAAAVAASTAKSSK